MAKNQKQNHDTYKFLSLLCGGENKEIWLTTFKDPSERKYPKHFCFKLADLKKELHHWKGTYSTKSGKTNPYYFKTNNTKYKDGVFFIVNGGGTKNADIKDDDKRAFFIDVDFCKEKFTTPDNTEESTKKLAEELKQTGKYDDVKVKQLAGKFYVETYKTQQEIKLCKEAWREKFSFKLKDALIVETYSGYHIYWLLDGKCSNDLFKKVEEYLIYHFNADVQCKNPARPMRVPGFFHQKYKEPFLVNVLQWSERCFTTEEFIKEMNVRLEKGPQTRGVVTTEEMERISMKSDLVRGVNKKEHLGRSADIKFYRAQKPIKELTYNEAREEILKRPLKDFIASPIMEEGEMICCPFHNDSNPSASIFTTQKGEQVMHCHACTIDTKNVIGMYKAKTGKKHKDAIIKLASFIGIDIVETAFERENRWNNRENRHFLEEDIDTYWPALASFIRPYGRISSLRHLNDKAETKILSDKESYEGRNVFFVSIRYLCKELEKKSLETVYRQVLLFCLLGLIKRVPIVDVPKNMLIRAKKETASLKEELSAQGEKGKKRAEAVRDINFYTITNWSDDAEEIEEMARTLIEKGFVMSKHLNKTGLIKLLGYETANKVFPDDRKVPKAFDALTSKIIELVEKEISEVGYCVIEKLISERIRYKIEDKKADKGYTYVKATKKQKEDVFKRNLNEILGENYRVLKVRSEQKRKMFDYYKPSMKEIKVIVAK